MATETNYNVSVNLRMRGRFERQMRTAARAIPPAVKRMQQLARAADRVAASMRGASARLMGLGAAAARIGIAGGTAGLGGMAFAGLQFNNMMENSKLTLATMFQMFDVGKAYVDKNASSAELFATNVDLARYATSQLMLLQKETPAGFADLAELYKSGAAGLAKGSKDIREQLDLVTQLSMLGPAINNDFGQIGRDTMRILSGGAGMDVLTWQLLREEIFAITKQSKLLGSEIKNNDNFVKEFNKSLPSEAKFKILQKTMGKLGPEFKKAFGESMGGLVSSTKSKLMEISGALTGPVRESFRRFLKRITNEGGILGPKTVEKWKGVATYFGTVFSGAADRLFRSIERAGDYILSNWNEITNSLVKAANTAGLILKAYIAQAMTRSVVGKISGAAGVAAKAGGGGIQFAGKLSKEFGKRKVQHYVGGGGTLSMMQKFRMGLSSLLPVIGASGIAFAVLGAALGAITIVVGAMAAYIVENWDSMSKSIKGAWESQIKPALRGVVTAAFRIWSAMVILGEAFLGGGSGANMAVTALNALETVLGALGWTLGALLKVFSVLNKTIIAVLGTFGEFFNALGNMIMKIPGMGDVGMAIRSAGGVEMRAAQGLAEFQTSVDKSIAMLTMERKEYEKTRHGIKAGESAEELAKRFEPMFGKIDKKAPKGGVHVENMYNQWDLRNTDPDRLMSAFMPKLEDLSDLRTQSYEQVDQGI